LRTRVKICGITRPEDALGAARAGADAIGLVFYRKSPRHVEVDQARRIAMALPPFVTPVGLFVDAEPTEIEQVLARVRLGILQFHGDESAEFCAQFGVPWIKAIRMRPGRDLQANARDFASGCGLLLDAYRPGVPGGTGETFDWDQIPADLSGQIILAGGLTPENVTEAIRRVRPYAVDVSGGVEVRKGIKDSAKISAFMRGVRLGQ
jgi:phosphoribosylanthranilate isomerase